MPLQVFPRLGVFRVARHLLRPPCSAGSTVHYINGIAAAHGEHGQSVQIINLPAHQVQHVRTDAVNSAAVPHFFWIGKYLGEALVIAVQKQNGIRQRRQHVQLRFVAPSHAENAAEISGDDERILSGQEILPFQFFKAGNLAVGIARDIDQFLSPPSGHCSPKSLRLILHWGAPSFQKTIPSIICVSRYERMPSNDLSASWITR